MLRFLKIARLAVIDAVEVEFEPGFNVLTGETGAGKSILVEAVGLLLGGRASGELVRTGEEMATVEAVFEHGDRELVIRREVTAQGRSRAFIDGALVTAGTLREMAADLIELHGQHEHQTLLDPATHLAALDTFGSLDAERAATRDAFERWRHCYDEREALRRVAGDRANRLEFAAFQLAELDKAAPQPGEDDELAATRRVLSNAARIERLCTDGYSALYDSDAAVLSGLAGVWKRVTELATLDPAAFEPHLAARHGIKAQLEELAELLRRYADDLDVSPARLQQTEDRLALLDRLKRKHGPTLDDVIARRESLRAEVAGLESSDDRLAELERTLTECRARFLEAAGTLSTARRHAARTFAGRLVELLAGLALPQTLFEVRFSDDPLPETEWSAHGIDRAEFYISPNPGEDLRPLARIVSGGELSRVMLALKTMAFKTRLASSADRRVPGIAAPGMIFDEVDAGIGGRVADVVGRRLRDLGSAFQVLCITHLPQVAAHADTHFLIEKQVDRQRTHTRVTRLARDQRVDEIARMMAGEVRSEAVRASAREMLANASRGAKGESKSKGESESRRGPDRKERRGA
ncbi:MAG: DNA repair protein RecN [Vicinamibacterales bacterium]